MAPTSSEEPRRTSTSLFPLVLLLLAIGSQPALASVQTTQYGPYSDGCYYDWSATAGEFTGRWCPQADGSVFFYEAVDGKWVNTAHVTSHEDGSITMTYTRIGHVVRGFPDGRILIHKIPATGTWEVYGVWNSDGIIVEVGYIHSSGSQNLVAYLDISGDWVRSGDNQSGYIHGGDSIPTLPQWFTDHMDENYQERVCLAIGLDYDVDNDGYVEYDERASERCLN